MTDLVEITLLNLDSTSKLEFIDSTMAERGILAIAFELSQEIKVEKRQVTSIPGLFGDLGGLYEFLATIVVALVSGVPSQSLQLRFNQIIFRVAGPKRQ